MSGVVAQASWLRGPAMTFVGTLVGDAGPWSGCLQGLAVTILGMLVGETAQPCPPEWELLWWRSGADFDCPSSGTQWELLI